MIRNSDVDAEKLCDRSERSLDLTQSKAKNQPQCQTGLDRQVGVNQLAAALSGCRCVPCGDGVIGQPNCQASPPHQSRIILWPVRHLVLRRRYLVAAGLVEFVGHGRSPTWPWRVRLPYRLSLDLSNHPRPPTRITSISRDAAQPQAYRCTNAVGRPNLTFTP